MRGKWRVGRWITAVLVLLAIAVLGMIYWNKKLAEIQRQALILDNAMHFQMASGDLAGIYNGADEQFRNTITREKSDDLFKGIARKLGAPQDCTQGDTRLNFGMEGTKLISKCETHFEKNATGTETFTWMKTGETYSLLGYDVSSDALLRR